MKVRMERRRFLTCVGGGLLALPTLEGESRAEPNVGPRRFLMIARHDGVLPEAWYPSGGTQDLTSSLKPALAPLEPHRSNLLIVKGLDNVAAYDHPDPKIRNGHWEGVHTYTSGVAGQGGTPIHGLISEELRKRVPTPHGVITMAADKSASPMGARAEPSLKQLFSRLFEGNTTSPDTFEGLRARRKSILDATSDAYQRLATQVSGVDRMRVEAHLQAIRELEKQLGAQTTPTVSCGSGSTKIASYTDSDLPERWRSIIDIVVLAYSCNATRVLNLAFDQSGAPGPYLTWLGQTNRSWHAMSHDIGDPVRGSLSNTQDPGGVDDGPTIRRKFVEGLSWFSGTIAGLVTRLKAVKDAEGNSLFDHTVMLQGSDCSFGASHSHRDAVTLFIAGDKTRMRTGRYVNLAPGRTGSPGGKGDGMGVPHNNMLVSLAHAFDINIRTFGDTRYNTKSLDSELLTL
jgi:hypothetical protein